MSRTDVLTRKAQEKTVRESIRDDENYLKNFPLPNPSLDELRVELAALVAVFEAEVEGGQLGVTRRAVGVQLRVVGIAFDGFRVVLYRCAVVT